MLDIQQNQREKYFSFHHRNYKNANLPFSKENLSRYYNFDYSLIFFKGSYKFLNALKNKQVKA